MSKKMTKRQRNTSRVPTHNEYMAQTRMSLQPITPLTEAQARMRDIYVDNDCMGAFGSAGTGKSYLALGLSLYDVIVEKIYDRIIIVRTAVQTRDQGFMPGDLNEKMSYYEGPYSDIVNELMGKRDAYKQLKERGQITFMSSSFVRGLTFDNAIIIFDECQNANYDELRSVITRVGQNSKIIFCGDTKQDDLKASKNRNDKSGLVQFIKVLEDMEEFDSVTFTTDDIVRSGMVKSFIVSEELIAA